MFGGWPPPLALVSLLGTWACGGGTAAVTPPAIDVRIKAGEARAESVAVVIDRQERSHEPLDVLLLFDTTASMGNVIDTVKGSGAAIAASISDMTSDARFAVAGLSDYAGGQPWRLYRDFDIDTRPALDALNSIQLTNGEDIPEAYGRAFHEAAALSWRADARRILVLFGDAPAHDPDFYGTNYGIDPGIDGVPGTADDLTLRGVVAELKEKQIVTIAVHDSPGWFGGKQFLDDAIKGFEFVARETGGVTKAVGSASEVPAAITAGIRSRFTVPPALGAASEWQPWVHVGPAVRDEGQRRFVFPVTLQPPAGSRPGVYRFPLTALSGVDGLRLGRTDVVIRIGFWSFPARYLILPLLLLMLALFVGRNASQSRRTVRWHRNGQVVSLLWRAAALMLLTYALWVAWQMRETPAFYLDRAIALVQ